MVRLIRHALPTMIALVLLAGCQMPPASETTLTSADRCGGRRDDDSVARALAMSPDEVRQIRAKRALTNDEMCTIPMAAVTRAYKKSQQIPGDNPSGAARWRAQAYRGNDGTIRSDGLARALDQRTAIVAADARRAKDAGISNSAWTAIGPNNIAGRIRQIAIHPTNANRMWAASVSGGVFTTADGGTTWSVVTDFMGSLTVSSIALDPNDSTKLYATTGEQRYSNFADTPRGGGLYRSTDSGSTWTLVPATNPAADSGWYYGNRVVVQPGNSNVILVATGSGIYRSADGGTTFTRVQTGRYQQVLFDPNTATNAVAGALDGTIAYTTDAGATWTSVAVAGSSRIELAYAKTVSGTVYASVDLNSGTIYRSTNGGASWSLVSTPGHLGSQGDYDNTIWVDPTNVNYIVVGGIDLYRSADAGASFTKISTWSAWPNSPHADHHWIVHHPSYDGTTNRIVFVSNDGGVYKSSDIRAAAAGSDTTTNTWSSINNGLSTVQFYGGAASADGTLVVGGTQDNGNLATTSYSTTWRQVISGDGGYYAVDQADANYSYSEYVYASMQRSTDGAVSAQRICSGIGDTETSCGGEATANFIAPFVMDPNANSTLLVGGRRLWRTTNAKADTVSWSSIKAAIDSNSAISAIAVAKTSSNVIYVGHSDGSLYKTTNGSSSSPTWTALTTGATRQVNRVWVAQDNANEIWVALSGFNSGNLLYSADGGSTFSDRSVGLPETPIRTVVRHPTNGNLIYVGTEVGIFSSEDKGRTWSTSNDGPANVAVDELFWVGSTTTLIAATHGRGMYRAAVDTSRTIPQSGWYYVAGQGGRGYAIEVRGTNIFLAGFLYADDGSAIWYVASGTYNTNSMSANLAQYANGPTLTGTYRTPISVGNVAPVTLQMTSSTAGTLTFGTQTLSITRYPVNGTTVVAAQNGSPETGWWYNPSEGGVGWFFEVQGSQMFMAAYVYAANGQATWYYGSGSMTSPGVYETTLNACTGGQSLTQSYRVPTCSTAAGTSLTVQFTSSTTATSTVGGVTRPLQRYRF